jgi:hypothetical protein
MVSWPYREGLRGIAEPLEVPATSQFRGFTDEGLGGGMGGANSGVCDGNTRGD